MFAPAILIPVNTQYCLSSIFILLLLLLLLQHLHNPPLICFLSYSLQSLKLFLVSEDQNRTLTAIFVASVEIQPLSRLS